MTGSAHHTRAAQGKGARFKTIIVGGGQAGLAVGYHLAKRGQSFVILDAGERIGDTWRKRWDSLRLFTPARFCGLPEMPFPAAPHTFPTKDEMAAYLEAYAAHFELPVRMGVKVDRLSKSGDVFTLRAGDQRFEAENVVVAMANYQQPRVPPFAHALAAEIRQFHSSAYRNPSQLQAGAVLVVGAGNSGAEIALELSRTRPTWLSGQSPGQLPFRLEGVAARRVLIPLLLRLLFHHVLTVATPIGRKIRPKLVSRGGPLVRTKLRDLVSARVKRVPRTAGVKGGKPVLSDGRVLEVRNVVWCTGYRAGFSWLELPLADEHELTHQREAAEEEPGLYFVGLHFLYALSSAQIHGVGRDAARVADAITSHARHTQAAPAVSKSAGMPASS